MTVIVFLMSRHTPVSGDNDGLTVILVLTVSFLNFLNNGMQLSEA